MRCRLRRWLTGNVADAEDIVQDACIRAYKVIASARDGNPRAWLLAIVRNTAFHVAGQEPSQGFGGRRTTNASLSKRASK